MTFSSEYIQEVTTKMPHVQAYWRKRGVRVGDWVAIKGYLYHVTLHGRESDEPLYVLQDIDEGMRFGVFDSLVEISAFIEGLSESGWLLTLSDLWDGLKDNLDEFALDCRGPIKIHNGTKIVRRTAVTRPWLPDESTHDDIELAAARLLDCVLAGKEGQ